MMVRHTSPERATEGFGLYGLSGRATAFLAPTLIGIVTAISGDARIGISPLVVLFIIGLILLIWVHPKGETDSWDLPDAVGPEIKIIFLLLFDFNPKISSLVSIIDNSK